MQQQQKRKKRGVALGAAMVAVLATAVACASPAPDDEERVLRIGMPYLIANFDIANFGGGLVLAGPTAAVYEPLVMWDRSSSTFDPWLAEEYEVSDDGLTVTMKLREDVDFVDGSHLDAEGVVAFLESAFELQTTTFYDLLRPYEPTMSVTGEYTFDMNVVQPIRFDFFYLLEEVGIAGAAFAADNTITAEEPLGTGPYLVEEIVTDVSATLVRNSDYWNPEAYPFDRVTFTVFDDKVAALNALKSGQIDAAELSLPLAVEAESAGFRLNQGAGSPIGMLYFADRAGTLVPALGDVRVRQAINMAFDREQIAETLDLGFGTVSSQPLVPGMPEYIEGEDDAYPYDPEAAQELLAEAGYPGGFDLTIGVAVGGTEDVEPIIQQSLADIGVRVTYETYIDGAEWVRAVNDLTIPVIAIKNYPTNVTRFLIDGSVFAENGTDPAIADMIREIEYGSLEESATASQEFGQYLIDEAWFAPFSKPPTIWASTPEIQIEVGQILSLPNLRGFQLAD